MSKKNIYLIATLLFCIVGIIILTCSTFTRTGFYNQNEWTYTVSQAPEERAEVKTLSFLERLAKAAEDRCQHQVIYDGAYVQLDYPGGDVAANRGVCTDVVIRSYRTLGIDLQVLVHEDMRSDFGAYPNLWRLSSPDKNIDHRRVPNLMRFFTRHGWVLDKSKSADLYKPGHIVAWRLSNNRPHIGIVSSVKDEHSGRYKIVHNIGAGPRREDCLFSYEIVGHYTFDGQ